MMVFKDWRVLYVTLAFHIILVQGTGTDLDARGSSDRDMSEACRIFCRGKLLQYVQMSRIFNDSKHFVDMKLRNSPDETENRFNDLLSRTKDSPSRAELKQFVDDNFVEPGTEFETWNPDDWIPMPKYTYDVYDRKLRSWIREVNNIWKSLGRKISSDVDKNGNLYSQIYVPNPFIVPGGRFTELYYWDSYWIIEGLLLSEMQTTAKGMIENFLYLVKKYGYIPNGSRLYYLGRSQPPFLISMVDLYWQYTKDKVFLKESIDTLEKEFNFWLTNRSQQVTVDGITHRLYQYKALTTDPRPESYYEDMNLFNNVTDKEARSKIFSEMKSGAESGWDFSTRWFLSDGEHSTNLSDISILSIAPVCLNSLMGLNAKLMSQFYFILENQAKHKEYKDMAEAANITMSRVFWSDRDGMWLDFNIETKELIPGFYPSNLIPLWTDSYGEERDPEFVIEQAIAYLDRNHIFDYPGGVPASLIQSGQQWDMPNGWAPLQYFMVMGFHKAGKYNARAKDIAYSLARDWVLNVYQTYLNSDPPAIFEKYNVTERGMSGGGGEYKIQEGFGWTNAVVMKFLSIYGHKIKTQDIFDPAPIAMGLLLMLVSVAAIINYMHRVHVFKRLMQSRRSVTVV